MVKSEKDTVEILQSKLQAVLGNLDLIKNLVCEEDRDTWTDPDAVAYSRQMIANMCDATVDFVDRNRLGIDYPGLLRAAQLELVLRDRNKTPLLDKYASDIQAYFERAETAEARVAGLEQDVLNWQNQAEVSKKELTDALRELEITHSACQRSGAESLRIAIDREDWKKRAIKAEERVTTLEREKTSIYEEHQNLLKTLPERVKRDWSESLKHEEDATKRADKLSQELTSAMNALESVPQMIKLLVAHDEWLLSTGGESKHDVCAHVTTFDKKYVEGRCAFAREAEAVALDIFNENVKKLSITPTTFPQCKNDPVDVREFVKSVQGTPSSLWRASGKSDPHDSGYDCERSQLCGGHMTDDELANAVLLDPNIANLTSAKDRIRWLSRKLEQALAAR